MRLKIPVLLYLPLLLSVASCNKYLDVTPRSSVAEEEIFSSETGFQQALSGIYSTLSTRNLFGDNLSMGFVSALAQNYTNSISTAPFYNTTRYIYQTSEVLTRTNSIWKAGYNAIASANNILQFSVQNRSVLSTSGYSQIRGEALGLRAYVHFELLRIFAKSYLPGANEKAIPYKTTFDQYPQAPSTVSETIELALKDLEEATQLLKTSDPILTNTKDRQIKMNYYAARALEARIRLYKGDKEGAYKAAKEVIESGKFPFVNPDDPKKPAATKDRLFKSELVFGLRGRNMSYAPDEYFTYLGTTANRLTRTQANFNTLYEVAIAGNSTDLRYVTQIESSGGFPFSSKFWQTYSATTLDSNRLDRLIPLIRMTEMLYILTETAPTLTESLSYLNQVRKGRTIAELTPATLTADFIRTELTKEYQKEFYAEGQLFFYYKRLNATTMQFYTGTFDVSLYQLPLPDDELEFNPNY